MVKQIMTLVWLVVGVWWGVSCTSAAPEQSAGDIPSNDSANLTAVTPTVAPGQADFAVPPAWFEQRYNLPVAAQQGSVVRLQPASVQLNVNDVTNLEIRIDNVTDLVAADVAVQFDPAILQVQDVNSSQDGVQIQPGDFPAPEFLVRNVVSNTVGLINYTVSDLAPFQPVGGSGLLATIRFQAVAQGSSAVSLSEAILVNSQTQSIPVERQAGQITVGQGGPTSTPTNTPLPGEATATFTPMPIPGTETPILVTATPIPPTATNTPAPTNTSTPLPTPTATNTPVAPQVNIPPGATVGFCYRVQLGETLYSLGQKFSIDPHFISLANDLHPPDYVFPQQILFMPEQYGQGPNVYLVKAGDTIPKIAEACRLDVDFVASVNGVSREANLEGLDYLLIPRPPYPPPSRYPYPGSPVWPPVCKTDCR
jgi:LysM repeat protein